MYRIVIDTNVLVSGLLKPGSKPDLVLMIALEGDLFQICLSEEIFIEYQRVLGYDKFKKYLSAYKVDQLLAQIEKHSLKVTPQKKLDLSPDPEDNKFLECALEARAGFIITGNIKHFPFQKFKKTLIVSPSEFLDSLAKIYFA